MNEGRKKLKRLLHEAYYEFEGHWYGIFNWKLHCLSGGYKFGAFDSNNAPVL